jgi:signal peptide peptidase SppA
MMMTKTSPSFDVQKQETRNNAMTTKYPRVTGALASRIWAMTPEKLTEVSCFIESLIAGRETSFQAMATPAGNAAGCYSVEGRVAVIQVEGIIERRANMVGNFSGGISTQMLAGAICQAAEAPDIEGIVLDIDSPGGSALAPEEVSQAISQARQNKPVVAWTGGQMCSAAYWIAAGCDCIVAMPTSIVGSIGVACVHYDRSMADEQEGIKRTIMSAGKYKRLVNDAEPLSDEGREYIQSDIDRYFSLFVDAVAQGRGMAVEEVLSTMADGSTSIGQDALDRGLVDRIGNFQMALELARARSNTMTKSGTQTKGQLSDVTLEELQSERPDLCDAVSMKATAETEEKIRTEAAAAATGAERDRIVEILEADGDQAVTMAAIKEGTPAADVYKAFFQAGQKQAAEARENLKNSLSGDIAGATGRATASGDTPAFLALVEAYQKENGCSRTAALSACAAKYPEKHRTWLEGQK